jgi:hypothetical protein
MTTSTFANLSSSSSFAGAGALAALLLPVAAAGCGGSSAQWPSSPMAVQEVAAFDGAKGQLPEGVAVRGDTAYMGYAGSGEVVAIDLNTGAVTPYGSLPAPVPNKGFVTGLAVHGDELYGDRKGQITPLASGAPLNFPASVTFADSTLYISNFALLDAKTPALLRIR